jgi:hypothetical protein
MPTSGMGQAGTSSSLVGGLYKPHRTDLTGGIPSLPNARLNILIVFVQFSNETIQSSEWPIGDTPVYKNDLLALAKEASGNYWDRYNENTDILSDWFQEVSKGRMHITGKAYNIVLDHPDTYYATAGMTVMNNEIYQKLQNLGTINWQEYDRWRKGTDGLFYNESDTYIDMIFKVHRHRGNTGNLFAGSGGYAYLGGTTYTVDPFYNIRIDPWFEQNGSGLTIFGTAGGPVGKLFAFGVARHEYGHYLFGYGHNNYGVMGAGDAFFSPWECSKLGYQTPQTVDYDYKDYTLEDFSSRLSAGEVLKVPINLPYEFLLISNRRKISKYDVLMLGDTLKGNILEETEYGKGLYIDHIAGDFAHPSPMDIECADGLWDWEYKGQTTPDWSPTQLINIYEKNSFQYPVNNDDGIPSFNNRDGRSMGFVDAFGSHTEGWFSRGKRHPNIGGVGIDRVFTNDTNFWTSRARNGDRWDPWNIGYNQVFSPYSNPNTKDWNNDNTGIFIYYESLTSGTTNLKIFRADEGGYNEEQILSLTPPSKPMNLKIQDCGPIINNYYRIRLTWDHNMEPDMRRLNGTKRYKIYRTKSLNMSITPPDKVFHPEDVYQYLGYVDFNEADTPPTFVDQELVSICNGQPDGSCPPICWINYPVRYRVQAVDKYEDPSVLSDFASTQAWRNDWGGPPPIDHDPVGPDNVQLDPTSNNIFVPEGYELYQNYPNPFNPVSNIQYDLPLDNFVTLKIYDLLGKEVMTLVDEFKNAGRYIISFNASNLASGIYYYKIKTGSFEEIRKMILLK